MADNCGERTFPRTQSQRAEQLATANRYQARLQYEENSGEQWPLPVPLPGEHSAQTNSIASFAPTSNSLATSNLHIQRLNLQSLPASGPHFTTSTTSSFEGSAAYTFSENRNRSSDGAQLLVGLTLQTNVDANISDEIETILASRYHHVTSSRIRAVVSSMVANLDEESQRAEHTAIENIPDFGKRFC